MRSSISRLKRRGLLDAAPDGVAGYALSEEAREILAEGDGRIFGRRRAEPSDGWVLVVFCVPEAERDQRHELRSQLTWLGFGTVSPGVWIAPAHLSDEAGEMLDRAAWTSTSSCSAAPTWPSATGTTCPGGGTWTGCTRATRSSSTGTSRWRAA